MKYPSLNCNAENFIERAKNTYGLQVVSYPTLGGIMVWQKGSTLSSNDGAGHVAIVERIDSDNQIYTSESGYGSSAFWNSIRTNSNGRWGLGSGYTFRGCIVNPAIGDVHYSGGSTPTPGKSIDEVAKEVIAGQWGNNPERKQRLEAAGYNYNEVQARVNAILAGGSTPTPSKSIDEIAQEVIRGNWGNGDERKSRLEAAGYNYSQVQAKVNEILNASQPAPSFDLLDAVKKTMRGDYGNGQARKDALGSHYNEVQNQVNLNLQHGTTQWDNIRLY